MFQTSGTCTQQQPGIPDQVVQHLNHIRLENLLAPRWSIILNEHGCQLQVFWGAPKNALEVINAKSAVTLEPPVKKIRPDGPITFVNQSPASKPPLPSSNVAIRQIGAAQAIMRQNHIVSPKSPKSTKPLMTTGPITSLAPQQQQQQQQPLHQQQQQQPQLLQKSTPVQPPPTALTPRSLYNLQDSGPPQRPTIANLGPTIAQVLIPTRTKENRKSIESIVNSMGQNREFAASNSSASPRAVHSPPSLPSIEKPPPLSPPGIVTPPSSERSSSGDGKEPDSMDTSHDEKQGVVGMDFISEMYRQKFSCEICRKTFTRKYSLSRHYKEVHQGESRSNKFQTIGPSMVTGQAGLPCLPDSRLLNDYGLPSMARLPFHSESDVKIEEYDDDDSAPSMVIKRQSPLEF